MNKSDPQQDAMTPCTFRALSTPSGTNGVDLDGDCGCDRFKPLFQCDGSASSSRHNLTGDELAAYLEEVQRCAAERGQDDGREEACRLAQASLLPHLKSVIEHLNAVVAQVRLAEDTVNRDSIALAKTIVEQVTGSSANDNELDDVMNELRRSISNANRYQLSLNRDDLRYLQQLMKENRLSWPEHPGLAIDADATLDRGKCHLSRAGDGADTIDDQAADVLTAFLSGTASRTA